MFNEHFLSEGSTYLNAFSLGNIWCFAEMGLLHFLPTDIVLPSEQLGIPERYRNRLTFLTALNADGFECFPLHSIESEPNEKLESYTSYDYNKRGWITPEIFNNLMKHFVSYILSFPGNRIVVLAFRITMPVALFFFSTKYQILSSSLFQIPS